VHLRHGVWSALQSLGAMRPSISPIVHAIGGLLGLGIGLGFIVMPLALYFGMI
jgi:succinate dehydrogenase / fumarate reductase cytochrome b subunit